MSGRRNSNAGAHHHHTQGHHQQQQHHHQPSHQTSGPGLHRRHSATSSPQSYDNTAGGGGTTPTTTGNWPFGMPFVPGLFSHGFPAFSGSGTYDANSPQHHAGSINPHAFPSLAAGGGAGGSHHVPNVFAVSPTSASAVTKHGGSGGGGGGGTNAMPPSGGGIHRTPHLPGQVFASAAGSAAARGPAASHSRSATGATPVFGGGLTSQTAPSPSHGPIHSSNHHVHHQQQQASPWTHHGERSGGGGGTHHEQSNSGGSGGGPLSAVNSLANTASSLRLSSTSQHPPAIAAGAGGAATTEFPPSSIPPTGGNASASPGAAAAAAAAAVVGARSRSKRHQSSFDVAPFPHQVLATDCLPSTGAPDDLHRLHFDDLLHALHHSSDHGDGKSHQQQLQINTASSFTPIPPPNSSSPSGGGGEQQPAAVTPTMSPRPTGLVVADAASSESRVTMIGTCATRDAGVWLWTSYRSSNWVVPPPFVIPDPPAAASPLAAGASLLDADDDEEEDGRLPAVVVALPTPSAGIAPTGAGSAQRSSKKKEKDGAESGSDTSSPTDSLSSGATMPNPNDDVSNPTAADDDRTTPSPSILTPASGTSAAGGLSYGPPALSAPSNVGVAANNVSTTDSDTTLAASAPPPRDALEATAPPQSFSSMQLGTTTTAPGHVPTPAGVLNDLAMTVHAGSLPSPTTAGGEDACLIGAPTSPSPRDDQHTQRSREGAAVSDDGASSSKEAPMKRQDTQQLPAAAADTTPSSSIGALSPVHIVRRAVNDVESHAAERTKEEEVGNGAAAAAASTTANPLALPRSEESSLAATMVHYPGASSSASPRVGDDDPLTTMDGPPTEPDGCSGSTSAPAAAAFAASVVKNTPQEPAESAQPPAGPTAPSSSSAATPAFEKAPTTTFPRSVHEHRHFTEYRPPQAPHVRLLLIHYKCMQCMGPDGAFHGAPDAPLPGPSTAMHTASKEVANRSRALARRPADVKLGGMCCDLPWQSVAHVVTTVTGIAIEMVDIFAANQSGRCCVWLKDPSQTDLLLRRLVGRLWMAPASHGYAVLAPSSDGKLWLQGYLAWLRGAGITRVPFPRHLLTAERWRLGALRNDPPHAGSTAASAGGGRGAASSNANTGLHQSNSSAKAHRQQQQQQQHHHHGGADGGHHHHPPHHGGGGGGGGSHHHPHHPPHHHHSRSVSGGASPAFGPTVNVQLPFAHPHHHHHTSLVGTPTTSMVGSPAAAAAAAAAVAYQHHMAALALSSSSGGHPHHHHHFFNLPASSPSPSHQ